MISLGPHTIPPQFLKIQNTWFIVDQFIKIINNINERRKKLSKDINIGVTPTYFDKKFTILSRMK